MTRSHIVAALMPVVLLLIAVPAAAETIHARLLGYSEVPAVSTTGTGTFVATIANGEAAIDYTLSYDHLEGTAAVAHIHLAQEAVNGGISAFLCGGSGKPDCPLSGTVTGTIVPADVIGPDGQGIAAGEFAELVRPLRAGMTYVTVHTDKHPGGEIRAQVRGRGVGQ